jgi:hypothetical protein
MKNDLNLDLFMETSAKDGYNTTNMFIQAALILYKDYVKYKECIPLVKYSH